MDYSLINQLASELVNNLSQNLSHTLMEFDLTLPMEFTLL